MKIRLDFVTNSSSSSFIIGIKGELTEENLLKYLGVEKSGPLFEFAKSLAYLIVKKAKPKSIEDVKDDYCFYEELPSDCREKEIFDNGMNCYQVSADNDSDGVELALYNMIFNYTSDDFIIYGDD